MTAPSKGTTNRANALASTGPKTAAGKARSAQNARKHGLSIPILSDPIWSEEVEACADELAGGAADTHVRDCARKFAIAQLEVCRIRSARHHLLFEAMDDLNWDTEAARRAKLRTVAQCARNFGPLTPMPQVVIDYLFSYPQGAEKLALLLTDKLHELFVLDRYERRALSKRKFAIRALDRALHLAASPSLSKQPDAA